MKHSAPEIAYIVSAYNRPAHLRVILAALSVQTNPRFECIVADNAEDPQFRKVHQEIVEEFDDRFRWMKTAGKTKVSDCYWSAEYAAKRTNAAWLCFPCDDTYYVPDFGCRMLQAGYENGWDLVICENVIVGPECNGQAGYKLWKMKPRQASKTTYIVRASAFPGFTGKLHKSGAVLADYHLSGEIPNCGVLRDQTMVFHH